MELLILYKALKDLHYKEEIPFSLRAWHPIPNVSSIGLVGNECIYPRPDTQIYIDDIHNLIFVGKKDSNEILYIHDIGTITQIIPVTPTHLSQPWKKGLSQ